LDTEERRRKRCDQPGNRASYRHNVRRRLVWDHGQGDNKNEERDEQHSDDEPEAVNNPELFQGFVVVFCLRCLAPLPCYKAADEGKKEYSTYYCTCQPDAKDSALHRWRAEGEPVHARAVPR
jgi:hypothetical protein